jgi:hypothetical protein
VPGDGALDVVLGNSLDPGAQCCENKNVDGFCVSSVSFFLRLLIFFSYSHWLLAYVGTEIR